MHSSRMRTAHLLTVSCSIRREGVFALDGGVPWGVYPSKQWGRHPPVNTVTDRCKNITLPQTSFAGGKNRYKVVDTITELGFIYTERKRNFSLISRKNLKLTSRLRSLSRGVSRQLDWQLIELIGVYNVCTCLQVA